MLKMNIISKVEIEPIQQEYLEELLREAIAKQDPNVYVNSFTFTQRRSPACIEVTVDAQIGAPVKPKVEEVVHAEKSEKIVETEQEETLAFTEPEEVEEESSEPESISSIFGGA